MRELKKKKEELEMARKSELVRPPDKSGDVKQYLTRVSEERKGVQNFPTKRETQLAANKDMDRESRKDRESLELKTSESLNRIGQAKESLTEFDMVHQWKA
jgi:hypothetical protein